MRYTINQAEAFYWVARLGSFRAAAARLNLTQPTVSLRVKEFERILGSEMFDRSQYRPIVSPFGTAIYPEVERMLAIAGHIEAISRDAPTSGRRMRIGAAETFASVVLPDLLARVAARHPSWEFSVTVDLSNRLEAMLHDRAVDIAFLAQPRVHERLAILPLWTVDHVWVVANNHPLVGSVATPLSLAGVPSFTTASPSGLHATMLAWFSAAGVEPSKIGTCNSLAVLVGLARSMGGAALVSSEIVHSVSLDRQMRILTPDPPLLPQSLCAMWWKDQADLECAYIADLGRLLAAKLTLRSAGRLRGAAKQSSHAYRLKPSGPSRRP